MSDETFKMLLKMVDRLNDTRLLVYVLAKTALLTGAIPGENKAAVKKILDKWEAEIENGSEEHKDGETETS